MRKFVLSERGKSVSELNGLLAGLNMELAKIKLVPKNEIEAKPSLRSTIRKKISVLKTLINESSLQKENVKSDSPVGTLSK